MNIKTAEELSGVSRQNIRFYEREGLLTPDRNPENDYREYHQEHIDILKRIRIMRMLDMPLDQIKLVLEGKMSPAEAAKEQKEKLKQQQGQLAAAIRFCDEWSDIHTLEALDSDRMLQRMESAENAEGLFHKWVEDYHKVVLSEREKVFTFIPEEVVTNPREFTSALCAYGNAHDLNLVITKESMYPEFTINGIEYTAACFYSAVGGIPVATIRCSVKYPEDFEPDVPEKRKKLIKLLRYSWLLIPVIFMLLAVAALAGGWSNLLSSWEGWVLVGSLSLFLLIMLIRNWMLHYNHKQ